MKIYYINIILLLFNIYKYKLDKEKEKKIYEYIKKYIYYNDIIEHKKNYIKENQEKLKVNTNLSDNIYNQYIDNKKLRDYYYENLKKCLYN